MASRKAAFFVALLALLAQPAQGQGDDLGVCLRVRTLYSSSERGSLDDAVLYVRSGKIEAIFPAARLGAGALPPEVPVLDRRDLVAVPGFVLAQLEVGAGSRDAATVGARFRALDAFDAYGRHLELLSRGITTVFLHPGRGRLVTGEGAVVKLSSGGRVTVLRDRAELCVELGQRALGPPPRVKIPIPSSSDVPIEPAERQRPTSRLALVAELQARLQAALTYEADRSRLGGDERPALDLDKAALAEAFREGRVRIDARQHRDLGATLRLARALKLRPVISGATEIYRQLDALRELGSPVVYEMHQRLRGSAVALGENPGRLRPRGDTPARLARAGVPFALVPSRGGEADLRLLAALAVRGGLSKSTALKSITSLAARVIGVGRRVGRLEPGYDADFALLSGDPLATSTEVVETWVGGERVYRAPTCDALVVRAGTIWTAAGDPVHDGEVLIQDGVIAAVGSSVPHPRGARVIDAGPGGYVTPGFIDAYSHLGYEAERGRVGAGVPLHKSVARAGLAMQRVARGGVTSVLSVPWTLARSGSRIVALKTAESKDPLDDLRRGLILRDTAGMAFDLSGRDPLVLSGVLKVKLAAGRAYAAKWAKHRKALEAWRLKQKKAGQKAIDARRKRRLKKDKAPEKKDKAPEKEGKAPEKEDKAPEKKDKAPEKKVDPISGVWEFTISGGPLPAPQRGELVLKLEEDGESIVGVVRRGAGRGRESPLSGRLEGTRIVLTFDSRTPFGPPRIEGEIVEEDKIRGSVRIGPMTLTFEATRTEREVPEIKITVRRRARGGQPEPPTTDLALEPLRRVFEGEGGLVLRVDSPAAALTVLKALRALRLPFSLLDFEGVDLVADALREAGVTVIVPPERSLRRDGRLRSQAAELAERGLRIAFMSNGGEAGAELPLRALAGVGNGVSAGQALRALTIDAARAFGVSDRVGSLEVGKDGDLLVFDGPPFEATSRLRSVVVGGRQVREEEE